MAYTKQVWKDLPDKTTPFTAERMNHIENGIENADKNNIFTSDEQVIGTWFNKPLYRKTISTTNLITANTLFEITHGIANIDKIWVDYSATFFWAASGLGCGLPMIGYSGNITDKTYVQVDKTKVSIYSNGSWANTWEKHITLLYTKTTD